MSTRATSPLRMVGYAALLTAAVFAQSAGRAVADTKFDLVTAPGRFLARALSLWDPAAAFGQIQNQAYGYAWPMGPFFWLGQQAQLPAWAVQRLWWSLLLCLAFFGVVRLAQRLGLGTPWTQVAAGFAFVLAPRVTTLLGATSVEVWPMALAPWVLLPLVGATERGSLRRAAACSALVVASCGGVNAIAVSAVLPLGVVWILTRERGPRRWRLMAWWTTFTAVATVWWWAPLLLVGRYSPPFLDYIENATITTLPTDLTKSLLGTSDWVAFFAGIDYPAGATLVTTPFIALDAAAIVALGLAGIAARGNPHQRFLALSVVVGLCLVGFGYAGDLSGWFADDRSAALDQALAPFRNLHKYDVVLRLPLVLGLAHLLAELPSLVAGPLAARAVRLVRFAAVVALAGLALPWVNDQIAPRGGVEEVPAYWGQVADYLSSTDDGTVALVVPAAGFGVYTWGNVHDDVLQGLAESPWAVRNVIPLAQPGNVVMLDEVTRVLETGQPSDALAPYLAAHGVGRLVVRNDLDRFQTGAPDPTRLRRTLSESPGFTLTRSFGPRIGEAAVTYADDGTRLVTADGATIQTGSVDVYDVAGAASASATPLPGRSLAGGPGSLAAASTQSFGTVSRPLTADAPIDVYPVAILTDGLPRRETNFARVRFNQSATMALDDPFRLVGPEHRHRLLPDQEDWETTEAWAGDVVGVSASSTQSNADSPTPIAVDSHAGAAIDGDRRTSWASVADRPPDGQWWQLEFATPRVVTELRVALASESAPVAELRIGTGTDERTVVAPAPGRARDYRLDLAAGPWLRVSGAGRPLVLPGSLALSEVTLAGLDGQRFLSIPPLPDGVGVAGVAVRRDRERAACTEVGTAYICNEGFVDRGEDGDTLARQFTLPDSGSFDVEATASLRRGRKAGEALLDLAGVAVGAPTEDRLDVAASPVAIVDDDIGTTWASSRVPTPRIRVSLREPVRLRSLRLEVNPGAAAAAPSVVVVRSGPWSKTVAVTETGVARVAGPVVSHFSVRVLQTRPAFSIVGSDFVRLPPGVSELRVNGRSPTEWAAGPMTLACGSGPRLLIDGRAFDSSLTAPASTLLRGGSVPLTVCAGAPVGLSPGAHTLLGEPTTAMRVEALTLRQEGAVPERATPVPVTRDDSGRPISAELPTAASPRLLTLPQNVNAGWAATLDGEELTPQRVEGWKQGWLVPSGGGGTVDLRYRPEVAFRALLVVGAALLLLTAIAVALPVRRREALPALRTGRPGALDLAVSALAGALLAGTLGLVLVAVAWAVGLRWPALRPWPLVAGAGTVAASLSLAWPRITDRTWALEWGQTWSLIALGAVLAALASLCSAGSVGGAGRLIRVIQRRRGSQRATQGRFL